MQKSNKELKRFAREQLNGKYSIPMGAFVIANLITSIIEIPFSMTLNLEGNPFQTGIYLVARYLITLIASVLQMGVVSIHLNLTRKLPYRISDIFYPFRRGADRFFLAAFFLSLFNLAANIPLFCAAANVYVNGTTVFSCLLLAAGALCSLLLTVCVSLFFQFTSYFLLDYPQMKTIAAFKESARLMRGNKGRFFYLLLSFIGWECLVFCSIGLASLWVNPYLTETYVAFYLDATGEMDRMNTETSEHF